MNPTNTRTRHPFVSFLVIAAFFQLMGGLMGWITTKGVDGWYQTLQRSPLNPPDAAFGIVWTILYFLLSVAFWLVWKKDDSPERTMVLRLFAGHMILNWLWSPVFFTAHAVLPAFALILVLIFTGAMLAWLIWPLDRKAAFVFLPYLGWLTLAGHLTHYIWQKN